MDRAEIASIELAGQPPAAPAAGGTPRPAIVDASPGGTQVNQGALITFDDAMPAQYVADVTYSLLFAQLAADAKHDRREAPVTWVTMWLDVLQGLGWIVERDTKPPSRELPPGTEWPALVAGLLPTTAAELCERGMTLAQAVPRTAPAMRIWARSVAGPGRAMFIPVAAREAGDPTIAALAVAWQLHDDLTKFFAWSVACLAQFRFVQLTLNESIYSELRQDVINRLGNAPASFVAQLPAGRARDA